MSNGTEFNYGEWKMNGLEFTRNSLLKLVPENKGGWNGGEMLIEAMRHGVLTGGKRVRSLLVLGAARMGNAPSDLLSRCVAAIECVHGYSLIHDDLPCMDDDELRRGFPTCHVKFGEATAILAGDALQTLAFQILSQYDRPGAEDNWDWRKALLAITRELAVAAGYQGMCMGQEIDQCHVGTLLSKEELVRMHSLKTGALIKAAVRIGAFARMDYEPSQLEHLDTFSENLGTAFQVVDDILDVVGDSSKLGKTAGKDVEDNKPTFVTMLGLEDAKSFARESTDKAVGALENLPNSEALRALAADLLKREF